MTVQQFVEWFPPPGVDAFRLELLDSYQVEDEQYPMERFRAGRPQDPQWMAAWLELVATRRFSRVHVITEMSGKPADEYSLWQITCTYPAAVQAGEDIRILPRHDVPWPGLPRSEFWLFDGQLVAWMRYDSAGRPLGMIVTDSPWAAWRCRRIRERMWQAAIPLHTYLQRASLRVDAGVADIAGGRTRNG